MKKRNILFILPFLIALTNCSYIEGIIGPQNSSNYGSLIINSSSSSSSSSSTIQTPYENESPLHEAIENDEDLHVGLPSTGDVKVLVIPVEIGNDKFSDKDLEKINLAFNGNSLETGYESVSSYYNKCSQGKLNIEATITPVFNTGKTQNYYESGYLFGRDIDYEILDNSLSLLEEIYDLSEYDYNKDSYIDGIYLIYSCDYSMDETSPWWAWCADYSQNTNTYDGLKTNLFVWASIQFLDDKPNPNTSVNINAETIIHETGHLFGLDDYYDYDEFTGPSGGLGGVSMMDNNAGDQDSFSKALLGWSNHTIVNGEGTYTLRPSESSNDCLIIPLRENENEILGEYLLIDYYTPTGLNKMQAGYYGLFTSYGVRIYHVDARIDPNIGSPKNLDGYYTIFSFNNSDTDYKVIEMIEKDNNNSIGKMGIASNSDLFTAGSSLNFIYNHDNVKYDYTIKITSIQANATISITKNKSGK